MSFQEMQLAPPILKALAQCGHQTPTRIQAEAIPKALEGRDIIASAQTGTGKTAAFVLPALHRLSTAPPVPHAGPRVLVLTPTRELADQITRATGTYGKYLKVKCVAIFGGMPFGPQIRSLSQKPAIVIATPGRLLDLMGRGLIDLSHLEILVIDEADRMLDMGFIEDVERIASSAPRERQTLLFAATVGRATTRLGGKLMKDPERIQIAPDKITHDAIEQRIYLADNRQHKNRLLDHCCEDDSFTKVVIFTATKRDADDLARDLKSRGRQAAALHGDMTQGARNRTMASMRNGDIRFLAATDVAARGLDIKGVSHIINFDLPRFAEDYVHRIGRTGRAGESGIAISFVSRNDLPFLDRIETYIGQNLPMHEISGLEPSCPMRGGPGGGRGKGFSAPAPGGNSRGGWGRTQNRGSNSENTRNSTGFPSRGKRGYGKQGREVDVEYRNGGPPRPARRTVSREPGKKIFS